MTYYECSLNFQYVKLKGKCIQILLKNWYQRRNMNTQENEII